ncbi:hypothetical protein [Streptomyces tritici]|uniref:hypothetical protein n=1 Tax=Streptomyces tritici TaxID=2054410 RepID=UPI003AEFD9AE
MNTSGTWRRRGAWLVAAVAMATAVTGCRDAGSGGETPGAKPPRPATPAKPSPGAPKKPGGGPAKALTCGQLRNAELQNSSLDLPDGPDGGITLTDGRWEGDGVVIELQPPCGIGDVTGDPAADAVGAIKVTTGGTGKFYGLVTWRNEGGTPVPAAAASLGDRTPVESINVPATPARRATVVYLTRGDSEPAAVVTIRRTAVFRVTEPTMVEVSHTDAAYTP